MWLRLPILNPSYRSGIYIERTRDVFLAQIFPFSIQPQPLGKVRHDRKLRHIRRMSQLEAAKIFMNKLEMSEMPFNMPDMSLCTVTEDRVAESIMTLLKRHRLAAGLTSTDVAKRVGVSVSSYSAWETGKNLPKPKFCKKLSRVLDIPALELTRVLVPEKAERSDSAPGTDHPGEGK
ncbi:MAG TPA: helix-turn-helix transcriptional regulator [Prosthecobacter sp.]|nr:helix-turn-helix transcriptional regulator [Prosthecobacter sp.]